MSDRSGIFAGENPIDIARRWLSEAEKTEPNDPNAIALSTVDAAGLPNVRMVLLKDIEDDAFVFYTNYESQKAKEIEGAGCAAFVMHWKSLRRQVRVRGIVSREDGAKADAYFQSRSLKSRVGAWASKQSQVLDGRATLVARAAKYGTKFMANPPRPDFWGGYRIAPLEIELWADGEFRLHNRFKFERAAVTDPWSVARLYP
ncbi:MAG: pyridoxamine 5'-phosphate oxidase [Halocynthiibacter sp.]